MAASGAKLDDYISGRVVADLLGVPHEASDRSYLAPIIAESRARAQAAREKRELEKAAAS